MYSLPMKFTEYYLIITTVLEKPGISFPELVTTLSNQPILSLRETHLRNRELFRGDIEATLESFISDLPCIIEVGGKYCFNKDSKLFCDNFAYNQLLKEEVSAFICAQTALKNELLRRPLDGD